VHAGGLACFSLWPPDSPTQPETKRAPALYRSCDELCGAKGAACTGVNAAGNSFMPGMNCGSPPVPAVSLCRCCAVAR
jgi:hypothetical protein